MCVPVKFAETTCERHFVVPKNNFWKFLIQFEEYVMEKSLRGGANISMEASQTTILVQPSAVIQKV